jgi:hypothetical protein
MIHLTLTHVRREKLFCLGSISESEADDVGSSPTGSIFSQRGCSLEGKTVEIQNHSRTFKSFLLQKFFQKKFDLNQFQEKLDEMLSRRTN